jgi:hypothetical protein
MQFRSCDQAVRFAYRIRERAEYASTDMTGVRGTSLEALSPMDLHAQSAMILNRIKQLTEAEAASVTAMYAGGRERADAMVALTDHLMPLVASDVPSKGALAFSLNHWVTRRPTIRQIASDFGVSYRQACKWRTAVARAWGPLHGRAMNRLESVLFGENGLTLD